ncbi:hypothetical protein UlMin_025671 [Ulmus minor]
MRRNRACGIHIVEREKISYIHNKTKPQESDDGYEKWYVENQKVNRWLLISMSPKIMKHLPDATNIWSALSKAFFNGSDEFQVFHLNQKIFITKQGEKSLYVYYGELTQMFHELDHRDRVVMKDADDLETYRKSVERKRVHMFLAGLISIFEQAAMNEEIRSLQKNETWELVDLPLGKKLVGCY